MTGLNDPLQQTATLGGSAYDREYLKNRCK